MEISFLDSKTGLPVADVIATHIQGGDTISFVSDNRGILICKSDFFPFTTSHINYKDTLVGSYSNKILLTQTSGMLNDVVIKQNSKGKRNNALLAVASLFYDCKSNLGHNTKAALFVPYNPKRQHEAIALLRYNVIDIFGVKNLKYLPFRASLYSIDTLTGLPGERTFDAGIIVKEDNKKWVKIDVSSQNLKVPPEGLFIVFEILDIKDYKVRTIWSKEGLIDAVPALNAKFSNESNPRKSYRYGSCTIDMDCGGVFQWLPLQCQYDMDIEYASK